MNRYKLEHPNTVTVWFPTFSNAVDFLFNFRNSLDFEEYKLTNTNCNTVYSVKNSDTLNAIELAPI